MKFLALSQSSLFTLSLSLSLSLSPAMSSISPSPNPNPKTSMINQPSSTSNPHKKPSKTKRKKKNKNKSKKTRKPNWLELPEDVWFMILSRLKTIDIIENAQKVCMLFRKLCNQPAMFKTIDMFLSDAYIDLSYNVNLMTRFAVDRSSGGLVDISLEKVCDDDTLMYIVDRSKNLKRLVLVHYIYVSDECLIEAVKKLPMLEELQLILCKFSDETVEAVGRACPSLKSFSLNQEGSKLADSDFMEFGNEDARAIARSMPQLRHLQLIGNYMSNEGLKEILDGCPLLETLDLRACFLINLTEDLGKRCEKIKDVRYPNDSTDDYPWQAYNAAYDEWKAEQDEDSDYIDMMGPFLDVFDYADLEEGDYDDFFREDEDYRLYRDYYRGAFLGYESSD